MLKKIILFFVFLDFCGGAYAQDNVYPAPPQQGTILIKNGTIHTAAGNVISNGSVLIKDGKIAAVGASVPASDGATVVDATGKQVYPGLILASTDLGIKEISSGVRGSNDYFELRSYNPTVRSIMAYNTDSKITNTLRANGILLACVVPQGRLLTGISSVVQLDAWTWQDAIYKEDNGLHLNMPMLMQAPGRQARSQDPVKEGIKTIGEVEAFFSEAQAYLKRNTTGARHPKLEALRPLFEKKQKLFVHADIVRQILVAIDFSKKFDIDVVLVGGADSYLVADLLKQNNIAVILNTLHELPILQDDDIDQPFKTPAVLQKAGVLFAINDNTGHTRYRNLCFNAGTAAAYGLTKEQALAAITINAAKILGIDQQTGSLENGKDATLVVSEGDILDMRTNIIHHAFIQGRKIDLTDKHKQLDERYRKKYGLEIKTVK